ncbi:MAG: MerR family transcriptional regulator [Planctomycetota bacterium]|jgi:MerR family Zn(II)-responsive transcriptional regulator of zntA|nr:MerR family transcriptional regulator [Planctomycetota bacterium]
MGKQTPLFDISALSQAANVSTRTIRYYGELGLLPATERGPGGRRLYSEDALERLRFISRLKHLGLSLSEIGELNDRFSSGATPAMLEQLDQLLEVRISQVTERISELSKLVDELDSYRQRINDKIS